MNVWPLLELDPTALRLVLASMTDAELARIEKVSRHWQGIGDKARREMRKRQKVSRRVMQANGA